MIRFILLLIIPLFLYSADLVDEPRRLKIFYSSGNFPGTDAKLKGRVFQIGTRMVGASEINQTVQGKSRVSVRLFDNSGILAGDTLYVVDARSLIIAKITVESVNYTRSFGWMMIGSGNFRRVSADMRVCAVSSESSLPESKTLMARGDRFLSEGDQGSAIAMYEQASAKSRTYPDPHIALGEIYLGKNYIEYAIREFDEAFKYYSNIYDGQMKFELLKNMAYARYKMIYEHVNSVKQPGKNPDDERKRFTSEALRFADKALKLNKNDYELYYYLGRLNYETSSPDDKKSKDCLLECLNQNPEYYPAMNILAKLYLKHGNRTKAGEYAENALKLNPGNTEARGILKNINRK